MSDTIDLAWIGATLRSIQAEQRSIRGENQLIRSALSEVATLLMNRIANFEAYMDTRFDQATNANADGLATILERLDLIAGTSADLTRRVTKLEDGKGV